MEQKITWMRYLRNGISIILLLLILSQCKDRVYPRKNVTYIYKNESGVNLYMFVKNIYIDTLFSLEGIDSFVFISNSLSGKPFDGERSSGLDSVGIKFDINKCLSFTRDGGNGVFRWPEYENYTNGMEDQQEYSLTFIFDVDWLNKAEDCN